MDQLENEHKGILPEISVVMPVYCSVKYLPQSIESILAQTYANFEFIIINEFGSDDGSKELIEEYARRDKRIRMIQLQKREGLAESLNIGIRKARGKYIARMDADDYSYPERLERQWKYMESHTECVLCGSAYRIVYSVGSSVVKNPCSSEEIRAQMFFGCVFVHPTVMFRRTTFLEHGWLYNKEAVCCEDFELWTRIDGEMANLPEVLVDYRWSGENKSFQFWASLKKAESCIIRKQMERKLHIETGQYADHIFSPDMNVPSKGNAKDLMKGYRLLVEIEEKNRIYRYCAPAALSEALCKQWNRYVWEFFFITGRAGEETGTPWISWQRDVSLAEAIARKMGVEIEGIEIAIDQWARREALALDGCRSDFHCIVYGTGWQGQQYFDEHPEYLDRVIGFCDGDPEKQGKMLHGHRISSPNILQKKACDYVVISSEKAFNSICRDLIEKYCVPKDRIASIGILRNII